MRTRAIIGLALAMAAVGCADQRPEGSDDPKRVGADRDEKGCIESAGYSWCASTNSCERPWELAKKAGFENSPDDYARYCNN